MTSPNEMEKAILTYTSDATELVSEFVGGYEVALRQIAEVIARNNEGPPQVTVADVRRAEKALR